MDMRWFGGCVVPHDRPEHARPVPVGARPVGWSRRAWLCGAWPTEQITLASAGERTVAVVGRTVCDPTVLARWAGAGVPDHAGSVFPGAYTVIEISADATVLFTDHGLVQPIYTATGADGAVLWGSSSLALAALTDADVDEDWLRAQLDPATTDEARARSAFAGVTPVPPGTRLSLRHGGGIATRPVPSPESAGGYRSSWALRVALADAVAGVGGPRVAADCSGGLDSTSLAMLLAHRARGRDLLAVTVHPAGVDRGGDLDYARAAVAHANRAGRDPRLEHLLCPLADQHVPYGRMLDLVAATDEPAPSTIAIARFDAELAALAERGVTDLLTGDGGDTLLGPQPGYLSDLAAAPGLSARALLVRHVLGWARLRRTPAWPLLAQARRGGPGEVTRTSAGMQLVARTARADAQITEQRYGISLHNPFTDPAVTAAALALPGHLRAGPSDYKPLLRHAMAGLLPSVVAQRRTKGDFTVDQYRGLRAHLEGLHQLTDGRLAERGLLDPDRYRALLTRAAAGAPGIGFHQLNPVLAAEVWLHAIATRPAVARWATDTATPATAGATAGGPR
ncbi:albusnodin/ikarugamycin family macrolactam cyclase [Pseudonocardia nantongensis]|uniref:albusnodin/ikarugamycin family macrolactam cyclase n=1 Tax=Pseudonocardia nantongensis TaxID=1181885 RepID=UPI00397B81FB